MLRRKPKSQPDDFLVSFGESDLVRGKNGTVYGAFCRVQHDYMGYKMSELAGDDVPSEPMVQKNPEGFLPVSYGTDAAHDVFYTDKEIMQFREAMFAKSEGKLYDKDLEGIDKTLVRFDKDSAPLKEPYYRELTDTDPIVISVRGIVKDSPMKIGGKKVHQQRLMADSVVPSHTFLHDTEANRMHRAALGEGQVRASDILAANAARAEIAAQAAVMRREQNTKKLLDGPGVEVTAQASDELMYE